MAPLLEASKIAGLIKPIFNAFKKLNNEWDEFMGSGLYNYLYSQTNKYYFVNTFLHRAEKVEFDNVYYPVNARYGHLITNFSNLDEVLDEYKGITIVGSAGSGKTTLIKYIFLRAISQKKQIPVFVELRNLNDYNGSFEKLISEKVLESRVKPSSSIFKRTLKKGNFIFLLDGYDEIFSSKKQEINRQLELFIDAYSENRFILTTRPGSGIERFPRFNDFQVCSLENADIIGFITKIVENKERRERIINTVQSPENKDNLEYLKNPLLLSMFILAFENHPEIPGLKNAFYRNVFDTLYSKHDGITKNSFPRERLTKLKREDFESILSLFCFLTLSKGSYTFTYEAFSDSLQRATKYFEYDVSTEDLIYDIHTSISIIILDGLKYSFPHRSMQEYFAALFISRLDYDKRGKAYNNLADTLHKSSADNSFTFWDLCFELDEKAFILQFLIPNLLRIYDILKNKKGKSLYRSYVHTTSPSLFLNNSKKNPGYFIYKLSSFNNSILDFCNVSDYVKIWNFPSANGFIKELSVIENEIDPLLPMENELVMELFLKYRFDELIIEMRDGIIEKVEEWRNLIDKQSDSIDELLSK